MLSRGLTLLQANHVKTPKLLGSRGSTQFYEAEVIGSEGDRYSTHVFISPSGIQSNCDCPYASQCKHGAAVVLALARGQQRYSQDAESRHINALQTLSENRLGFWLSALQQASRKESPVANAKNGPQLFYLVDLESNPVMLVPALRQRKKNGEWGRFDELSYRNSQWAPDLTRQDHKLLELFEQIQSHNHLVGNRRFYPAFEVVDELGDVLLHRALSTGRALDTETKEPLTLGSSGKAGLPQSGEELLALFGTE